MKPPPCVRSYFTKDLELIVTQTASITSTIIIYVYFAISNRVSSLKQFCNSVVLHISPD